MKIDNGGIVFNIFIIIFIIIMILNIIVLEKFL